MRIQNVIDHKRKKLDYELAKPENLQNKEIIKRLKESIERYKRENLIINKGKRHNPKQKSRH